MRITVEKLTDKSLIDIACSCTADREVHPSLRKIYASKHSPIRTQIFLVRMEGIPSFVSTHFVRHHEGVSHFVKSNREDIAGTRNEEITRLTPVNHIMLANAEALMNMSYARLCAKASPETREVMAAIKDAVLTADPDLYDFLVPMCVFRGGYCHEFKSCGLNPKGE